MMFCSGCSLQNFERRRTESFDFGRISTFSFDDKNCGIVASPPDEKNDMIAFIRQRIESELKSLGYIPVRVNSDTRIRFGLILKSNGKNLDPKKIKFSQNQEAPEYAATFDYKPGSLIIDAVNPFRRQIIWRSAVDTGIKTDTPADDKKKILERYIKLLLKDFPDSKVRSKDQTP